MASKLNSISSRISDFGSLSRDNKKSKLARLSKAYSTGDLSKIKRTGFAGVVNRVRSTEDLTKSDSNLSKRCSKSSVDLLTASYRNRTEQTNQRLSKNIEKDRNSDSVRQRDSNSAAKQRWQGTIQHTLSSQAKTKEARMVAESKKKRSTRLPPIKATADRLTKAGVETTAKVPVESTAASKAARPVRQDSVRPMAGRPPMSSAKAGTRQGKAVQQTTPAKSRVFTAPKPRETSAKSAKSQQKSFEAAVCKPCRLNITEKLKRGYNKYKKLDKPKQCGKCTKLAIDYDFYDICWECAKQAGVCAKCAAGSTKISGARFFEVVKSGMEENMLGMSSNQLKKFAEKHAKVHRLDEVLTPILNSETCSREASSSPASKSSPCTSRVSSANSGSSSANSGSSSAKHSPVVSVHSARSDMARTMTSSSSPVADPAVDSDEAYGSEMISSVDSDHRALSQQVSNRSDQSTAEAEILEKIRSLTHLDSTSPTMAQTVLREIRSLTDLNYTSDVLDTVDVFTNSRHQTPETALSPKQKSIIYDADIHPNVSSRTSTSLSRPGSSPKLAPITDLVSPRSSPLPPILSPRASLEQQQQSPRPSLEQHQLALLDAIVQDARPVTEEGTTTSRPDTEGSSRPLTEGGYMNEGFEEPELTVLIEDETLVSDNSPESVSRSISEDISNVGVQEEISNVGSFVHEYDGSYHSEEIMITPGRQAEEVMITPAPVKDNSEIDCYTGDNGDNGIDAHFDATYSIDETTQDFNDNTYNIDDTTIDETADEFDDNTYTVEDGYDDVFDAPALDDDEKERRVGEGIVTLEQTDTVTHPSGNEELYDFGIYANQASDEAKDEMPDNYGLYARSDPNLTESTQQYPSTSTAEHDGTGGYGNTNMNIMSMSTTGESFESTYESEYTNTDDSGLGDKSNSSDLIHRVPPISPTQEDWEEYQQQIAVAREECGMSGQYEILELHQSSDYPEMEFLENICYEYRGYPMRCRLEDIQEEGTLSKETTCVTCITDHPFQGDTTDLDLSLQTLQGIAQSSDLHSPSVERCEPILSSDYLNRARTLSLSESDAGQEAHRVRTSLDSEDTAGPSNRELEITGASHDVEQGGRSLEEELAALQRQEEQLLQISRENSLSLAAKDVVMGALLRVSVSQEGDQMVGGL